MPFNETQSIVKKFYLPQNKELIFHYPVDVISLDNRNLSFEQGFSFLSRAIGKIGLPHVKLPKYQIGNLEVFSSPNFLGIGVVAGPLSAL